VGLPHRSVWWSTLPEPPRVRPSLRGDLDVDVAIVGAGFTGLWTALALLSRTPTLRVAIVEAEVAGFGASGRNGGWASALYPLSFERIAASHGDDVARHLRRTLREGVAELGRLATDEGIECDYQHGGTITLARSELQARRLRVELDEARQSGDTDADLAWLDGADARSRCNANGVVGGLFTPHCAALHPAKLAVGLASAVERRGATIYEGTRVDELVGASGGARASAVTAAGTIRADVVVRATEGFTPMFRDARREVVPLYSLVIGTEPLGGSFFERVGLGDRETFTDARHLIIYGQRTADDRLVFGGRGAPYHLGSKVSPRFDDEPKVFGKLEATLQELFGELPGAVTHRWGGPLGMARDRSPYVRFDRTRGMASAGGYVGDGVVMSLVAGQALASLITGEPLDAPLPFVEHRAKRWEHEPLRWIGINAALHAADVADANELRTKRPSRAAKLFERLQRA
jgi:glycine/D-amino acid oxidase-like deaminating enzyme